MRGKIIENVTIMTKMMLQMVVKEGYRCIDATTGNGHDTKFLSDIVGPEGMVYGFDVQEQAIEMTKAQLEDRSNYKLICDGHQNMETYIDGPVDFVIFNLGYLPKADKTITTLKETTLEAIEASLRLLKTHGILWVVVYPGHDEGAEESEALDIYLKGLNQKDYSVMKSSFINQRNNPPYIMAIEKKC
ncbi:methyltransferase domain-containing protein [Acidaminobacter sp. JC074]|uniref:class I SAM-dependent methyltransferase n=1 Tax=Acidaminobacter sp. JC074 TaxID=2530199 RepID=UPI001F0F06DB|nr:class I SAM-dependent methyltransferase [Acidaminobacter sp. JC074]MCH4888033.1 methyltransferase domain-containing protein [Acidaminobacter sp. JC074]